VKVAEESMGSYSYRMKSKKKKMKIMEREF
jgi:hypothetical protein